jgi:hypothetical protein
MITTGYALLRYSASTPDYEGGFSHIVVVLDDLEKIKRLKNRLAEQNSGSYSDYFEIEEISQWFDEREILKSMNEIKE